MGESALSFGLPARQRVRNGRVEEHERQDLQGSCSKHGFVRAYTFMLNAQRLLVNRMHRRQAFICRITLAGLARLSGNLYR